MKIVIINASARKNGATGKILNEFADDLSAKGDVEIASINLSDLKLNFCTGCCLCYKTGVCHIADDADMLSGLINSADCVIIGSPTYTSSIPGQLKTFIDRGHFVVEQLLKGKYTVAVVTYENAGGGDVIKALKKLFVFSGASRFDKLLVKLPLDSDPFADPHTRTKVKMKSDRLYTSITKQEPADLIIKIINYVVLRFGIKPLVLKKGEQYAAVRKLWEMRNVRI